MSATEELETAQMEHETIKGDMQDFGVRKYTKYGNTQGVSLKSIIDVLFRTKVTGFKVKVIHNQRDGPSILLLPIIAKIGVSYITEEDP